MPGQNELGGELKGWNVASQAVTIPRMSKKKPSLSSVIISIWIWIEILVVTILVSSAGVLFIFPFSFFFDARREWMHNVSRTWASWIIFFCPLWKIQTHNSHRLDKKKTYVIVANHQSMADIFVVLAAIPAHFKFMAKEELFKVPFMGWSMRLSGYIPVNRASRESGRDAFLLAREWIEKGVNVLFFPEGTRSTDGVIKDFKQGAFKLAQEMNVEILPVVLDGTLEAIPKHSRIFQPCPNFQVSFCEPLSAKGNVLELKDKIHVLMTEELARLRGRK